jgi:uncharacterized membrane protein
MSRYLTLFFACHHLPERSFFFRGRQFPICSRCTGIMVGYFLGIIHAYLFGSISWYIAALMIIPLVVDGYLQFIGIWTSTNTRRLWTGIFAGIGTDFILYHIVLIGFKHGKQLVHFFF